MKNNYKKMIYPVLFLTLSACGISQKTFERTEEKTAKKQSEDIIEYYTCSMHPQVHSDKPGNCPICGMTLVPVLSNSHSRHTSGIALSDETQRKSGIQTSFVQLKKMKNLFKIPGKIPYDPNLYLAQVEYLSSLRTPYGSSLADATLKKLLLLGMSEFEIQSLRKKGHADLTLLSPQNKNATWVYAFLSPQDIKFITLNTPVQIQIPGKSEPIEGQILSIAPLLDANTQRATIRIQIPPQKDLKAEQWVEVFFNVSSENTLLLPKKAVIRTGTRDLVYVKDKNQWIAREVSLGKTSQEEVEILSGLKEGDEVITEGNFLVDAEAQLKGKL